MWNTAQGKLNKGCKYQGIKAIRMKINSPAYKLPNNRSANETGFAKYSTKFNKILNGIKNTLSNGCNNNSLPNETRL